MAGNSRVSELLTVAGGGLAVSAIVFGVGLFLLGSESHPATPEPTKAKAPAEKEKSGHGAAKKKEEHKSAAKQNGAIEIQGDGAIQLQGTAKEVHASPPKAEGHAEKGKEKEKAGGNEKNGEETTERPRVPSPADYKVLVASGDAALARGRADAALLQYQAAATQMEGGKPGPELLQRLAQAATQSQELPIQSRYEKALSCYSRIVLDHSSSPQAERAQYELGLCLTKLSRPAEAKDAYLEHLQRFPEGEHRHDAVAALVDILLAEHEPAQALKYLEPELQGVLPPEVRGRMESRFARAKLDLARGIDKPKIPERKADATGLEDLRKELGRPEVLPTPPAPKDTRNDDAQPLLPESTRADIPESQWAAARFALDHGKLREAERLLSPWYKDDFSTQEQGKARLLAWAGLLRAASALPVYRQAPR
jgi:tetratricopeptide (TPR) repeat protein